MPRRREYATWYDPALDPSPFMAALADIRRMCTRAELTRDCTTVCGSQIMIQRIMTAIDDFAEIETGQREYF